jgi:hypothetical protein
MKLLNGDEACFGITVLIIYSHPTSNGDTSIPQENPKTTKCTRTTTEIDVEEHFVDPVRRYLNYELAYLQGEMVTNLEVLSTWELRLVVDGPEPDEIAQWGRGMLRNYRPDHIFTSNIKWRYFDMVRSKYIIEWRGMWPSSLLWTVHPRSIRYSHYGTTQRGTWSLTAKNIVYGTPDQPNGIVIPAAAFCFPKKCSTNDVQVITSFHPIQHRHLQLTQTVPRSHTLPK